MIQKVLRVGSSAAVTIPKKSLKELGLKIGDSVSLDIDMGTKSVSIRSIRAPKTSARQKKIDTFALDFIKRYRKDLEALADK